MEAGVITFVAHCTLPFASREKSLRSLQEHLFAGPTKEPLLIPADIAQKIGLVENAIAELDTQVKRLERNFSSKQVSEFFQSQLRIKRK